mgnify:FL=1
MTAQSNSARSLTSSALIALAALVIGYFAVYEPAKRASLLPFLANEELSRTIYAISYLACWWLLWRYRRKYWPPRVGQNRAQQMLVLAFGVAAFPLFVGAWVATWPTWYTWYFGSPAQLAPLTVSATANLRKFRTPHVRLDLKTEERTSSSIEWAVDANPALPRVDRDWIGKTVCVEGKQSRAGFIVLQLRECTAR